MNTNRRRVAAPLVWRATDGLGANGKLVARSYGNEVDAVFTRGGDKYTMDSAGRLVRRTHSVLPFSMSGGKPTLLVEEASTNWLLRSQEFGTSPWSNTGSNLTITGGFLAPDGTMTAYKTTVVATATTGLTQAVTTIATTRATFSLYLKKGSNANVGNDVLILNSTTASTLYWVTINLDTGVLTPVGGTGTARSFACADGWWRVEVMVTTGLTSGDDITAYAGWSNSVETATEFSYIWGAQLEAKSYASSYIKTTSATVARITDSTYFPSPLQPQACSLYARFIESGMASGNGSQGVLSLGNSSNPSLMLLTGGAGGYYAVYRTGSDAASTAPSGVAAIGDVVELLLTFSATGVATVSQSINGGAITVGGASTAKPIEAAWDFARVYLGSRGGGTDGNYNFTHLALERGVKTMADMRVLAEVG